MKSFKLVIPAILIANESVPAPPSITFSTANAEMLLKINKINHSFLMFLLIIFINLY